MKLGDALGVAIFSAIAGTCAAYYLAARPPTHSPDSLPSTAGERAASHSSEGVADSAPISHSSRSVRQDTPSEVSSGPEGTPLQGVPEEDRDVSSVQDMSPLVFSSEAVQAFVTKHPNSPLRFVPKDATVLQMAYLEGQAEVILQDWQQVRDELWSAHKDNLLAFVVDPSVIENDKTRQQRMRSLVTSLWPDCMR